jgi:hypothetical protein
MGSVGSVIQLFAILGNIVLSIGHGCEIQNLCHIRVHPFAFPNSEIPRRASFPCPPALDRTTHHISCHDFRFQNLPSSEDTLIPSLSDSFPGRPTGGCHEMNLE